MLRVSIEKQLPDFNLQIEFSMGKDILVLFGPSGCGKTTTLRCIAGLVRPDAGYISYDGRSFYDSKANIFAPPKQRKIGYMFQDYALFPHMNVRQNIWYGAKERGAPAEEKYKKLLRLLKIEQLDLRHTDGLSGGEKQRVALARALMAGPEILLLDEPLSALDKNIRIELQNELVSLQSIWGIPFILVTHDLDEAKAMGDRILFIEKGLCSGQINLSLGKSMALGT